MQNIVFDLETVHLPTDQLQALLPVFDPESVKVGNLGPDKAAEKIEKARLEQFNRFMRNAALSAMTGRIVMLGIKDEDRIEIIQDDEPAIIRHFFALFEKYIDKGTHWIGFNIASFDIPFLIRRAWFHRLKVPPYGIVRGRYLTGFFTDLLELWNASERTGPFTVSLDDLAHYFGVGAKTGNGADFGELLRYDAQKAKDYLVNDLEITWKIAEAMGAFCGPLIVDEASIPERPANDAEMRPTIVAFEARPDLKFY